MAALARTGGKGYHEASVTGLITLLQLLADQLHIVHSEVSLAGIRRDELIRLGCTEFVGGRSLGALKPMPQIMEQSEHITRGIGLQDASPQR